MPTDRVIQIDGLAHMVIGSPGQPGTMAVEPRQGSAQVGPVGQQPGDMEEPGGITSWCRPRPLDQAQQGHVVDTEDRGIATCSQRLEADGTLVEPHRAIEIANGQGHVLELHPGSSTWPPHSCAGLNRRVME